jgi:hypothetical protein
MTRRSTLMRWTVLVAGLGALATAFFSSSAVRAADAKSTDEPVIIFVHGRGQSDTARDDVRARFINSFIEGQKEILGAVVVPESRTRFVWYADVIDAKAGDVQLSANCRFAAATSRSAKFKRELRASLIATAQALNLDDFGLSLLAGDTYKYLTEPAIRCEADTRVSDALFAEKDRNSPKVVVAHSMGGIVSYSAIERLSTTPGLPNRPEIQRFITLATQVGLPEVLKGLEGDFVKTPVPLANLVLGWSNFRNRGDRLAIGTKDRFMSTDPARLPEDAEIKGNGSAHAIETYLGNKDVLEAIVEAWCEASVGPRPAACAYGRTTGSPAAPSIPGLELMATNLEFFFRVRETAVQAVATDGSRTSIAGDRPVIALDVNEVNEFKRTAKVRNFGDAMFFYLAHEFAHIAQRERALAFFEGDPPLVVECNADLWAGIAFVMAQPMDPSNAFQRARDIISLSAEGGDLFPIGVHLTDKVASHPEALQRANCAATGINAGLFMFRKRAMPAAQAVPGDDQFAGLIEDPWQWSIQSARRIADYQTTPGEVTVVTWGPQEFSALAAAAESGSSALASSPILRSSTPPSPRCVYSSDSRSAFANCSDAVGISERLTFVAYHTTISMLRPLLLSRGWKLESAIRSNKGFAETFAFKEARCVARADFSRLNVAIEFSSTQ